MPSVLVIDDDSHNGHLIKTMLELDGYEVTAVHDVVSAWAMLEKNLPDLICCDLRMPGISGFDFLARREDIDGLQEVPVVAVTGNHLAKKVVKELEVSSLLYKPFSMKQLVSAVESALAGVTH